MKRSAMLQVCLLPWWGMICSVCPHSTCLSASSAFLVCAHDSQLRLCQRAVMAAVHTDTEVLWIRASLTEHNKDTLIQMLFGQMLFRDYTSSVLNSRVRFQAGWGFRNMFTQKTFIWFSCVDLFDCFSRINSSPQVLDFKKALKPLCSKNPSSTWRYAHQRPVNFFPSVWRMRLNPMLQKLEMLLGKRSNGVLVPAVPAERALFSVTEGSQAHHYQALHKRRLSKTNQCETSHENPDSASRYGI